jgi:EAL domain-containing protein (putative c-di-GMP-specific phosphodiesterase class I)/GGDEF domain-containing protein
MSFTKRIEGLSSLTRKLSGNSAFTVLTLDNVGHVTGQRGLTASSAAVAEFHRRVNEVLRSSDHMLVLADDRICVTFDELVDENHVLLAALKLERAFEEPYMLDGHPVPLDVRAGLVYVSKQDLLNRVRAEELYRFAETARAHATRRKVFYEISSEEVFSRMRNEWELSEAFDTALEQHELTLDYQPKYRLLDGELVGAEAIVRWRRGGLIIPRSEFVPALSNARLWDLTIYSVRRAIREMLEFSVDVPIAINVESSVLEHPSFLNAFQSELAIWSVEPSRLALEVAESGTLHNNSATSNLLNTIRSMGALVIIDHFGTGQASLDNFRDLPADEIKIDRSLIYNIAENADDQRITDTIIELAHRFSKTVVADGVDDAETFSYLVSSGCDVGQGFYLSAPLNENQFSQLLAAVA